MTGVERRVPRVTSLVLFALLAGLTFGAMVCAAGLATGHSHRQVTEQAAERHADHVTADRVTIEHVTIEHVTIEHVTIEHVTAGHVTAGAAVAAAEHDDGSGESSSVVHPVMACLISIDLQFPSPPVTMTETACDPAAVEVAAGWASDVEPPVPRFS